MTAGIHEKVIENDLQVVSRSWTARWIYPLMLCNVSTSVQEEVNLGTSSRQETWRPQKDVRLAQKVRSLSQSTNLQSNV